MSIALHIISPEGTLVKADVSLVTLPGIVSAFTVLKDHAPLITALTTGQIRYIKADGKEHFLPIKEGFVRVGDNKVTVCAEV